jgi:hypothetical protein
VVVLIVGLAGYAAVGFYRDAVPEYSVQASVVVLPSASLTTIRAVGPSANPFNATSGPTTLATLLADSLNTAAVQADVLPPSSALVAGWDSESGQLVTLTTAANDVATAQSAMTAVLGALDGVLQRIQVDAGTPVDQLYVATQGAPVDFPVQTFPDRLRTVVATVLAGLLVAVVLAVVLDSLLLRRRASRHAHPTTTVPEEKTEDVPPVSRPDLAQVHASSADDHTVLIDRSAHPDPSRGEHA